MKTRIWAYGWWYFLLVTAGWMAYLIITLLAPTTVTRTTYHITGGQLLIIQASFIVPILLIWLLAAYGTAWFKRYAQMLADAPEAKAFRNLADGIYLLLIALVAQSVIGAARSHFVGTSASRFNIIAGNYVQVIAPLLAFLLIYLGSRRLVRFAEVKPALLARLTWIIPMVALAAVYVWLMLHNANRTVPAAANIDATYYLSDRLIITTIAIPYIITWFVGALACFNLRHFSQKSQGIVYKASLRYLVFGLISVLLLSVVSQSLGTIGLQLIRLRLQELLLLVYGIVLLMGVAYLFIARGASRLARIEEV